MVICLERGADLYMAQLMPLPLTVSCFSKIQIGFTFLVPAHLSSPGKRAIKRVCVCDNVMHYYQQSHSRAIFLTWYSVGKIILTMLFWPTGGKKLVLAGKKNYFCQDGFFQQFFTTQRQNLANPGWLLLAQWAGDIGRLLLGAQQCCQCQ